MNPDCARTRLALGVYVLGTVGPVDRGGVEAQLPQCAGCREQLAALAGLPGLLGRLSQAEAAAVADSAPQAAGLERALLRLRHRRLRRRRRARLQLATAAVVLVAASAGVTSATQRVTPGVLVRVQAGGRWSGTDPATGARATAVVVPHPWGSEIQLVLAGVPAEEHCRLVAVALDGTREQAAGWLASYPGLASVDGATAIAASRLAALRVVTVTGAGLVTLHRTS